ncbi:MAG: TAXI family TRAP transporter solute-binding subunit [Spirochaetales bacterium]|nr:TAXI family TRAP transporter solute-binding subunit [Spirochaetales bacterium]
MKIFRKTAVLILILLLVSSFAFAGGQKEGAKREFIRFGGGAPGGSWFATVGGFASYISSANPNLNITAVSTGGSADNNRQAARGQLDTWLTHAMTALDLWTGAGEFKGETPYKNFRLISGVYESHHHFVTLASKTDINTLQDFAGKSVVMGNTGSGGAINSENILKALGIFDKVDVRYMGWEDAGRALQDGRIDAAGASSAPASAVVTLDAQRPIKLIAPSNADFAKIIAAYPSYSKSVIKAGTYSSVKEDSPCISFLVYWAAQKDLSEKAVYDMMVIGLDPANLKELSSIHHNLKTIGPYLDQMSTFPVPLHPGAVKYYREKGLTVPESLIPPEMK